MWPTRKRMLIYKRKFLYSLSILFFPILQPHNLMRTHNCIYVHIRIYRHTIYQYHRVDRHKSRQLFRASCCFEEVLYCMYGYSMDTFTGCVEKFCYVQWNWEIFFSTGYIRKVETLLLVLNAEKVHVSIMDVFSHR